MAEGPFAARIDDHVGHDEVFFGQVFGFGLGVVAAAELVALSVITLPAHLGLGTVVAVVSVLAVMETFASAGGSVAEFFPATPTGRILAGARTVFVGASRMPASRRGDAIECEDTTLSKVATATVLFGVCPFLVPLTAACCGSHTPSKIASGSATVSIEGQLAARVGDDTECGGKVVDGEQTVLIYGASASSAVTPQTGWVPYLFGKGLTAIEWASYLTGFAPLAKRVLRLGVKAGLKKFGKSYLRDLERSSVGRNILKGLGLYDSAVSPLEKGAELWWGKTDAVEKWEKIHDAQGVTSTLHEIFDAARKARR